ncbi:MAG: hydrolase [Herbinix sp.]|jgi:isopentenyldiphosphate isomerase|nr:hydrolase [Herbinix sp.]MDF2804701.1 hydrolase [Anaerocolumna sp.]
MSEVRDIYDKNRIKTGIIKKREDILLEGEFYMASYVCLFNKNGEMLIQKRSPHKKGWPNVWDFSVGGCSVAGETSQQTAEREMNEEIGYKRNLANIQPNFSSNVMKGFFDFYLIDESINIECLTLQSIEIEQVKWASKDEIHELLDKRQFMPHDKSLIEKCFELKHTILP